MTNAFSTPHGELRCDGCVMLICNLSIMQGNDRKPLTQFD